MALKPRTKKTSLAFMGEGWENAYIENRMMTMADNDVLDQIKQDTSLNPHQQGVAIVKLFFYGGKGLGEDGQLGEITPKDIENFDLFTLSELASQVGMPDPKASASSTTTTTTADPSPDDSPNSDTASDLA